MKVSGRKFCGECAQDLPVEMFRRDGSRKDGFGRKCKLCDAARDRNPTEARRLSHRIRQKRYSARFPQKIAAQQALIRAVSAGKLTRQPCEVCGEPETHGHHDDYNKPLTVRWLCQPHHVQAHTGKLPATKTAPESTPTDERIPA